MLVELTCQTCGSIMGTLEKDLITNQDMELGRLMHTCENNCGDSISLLPHDDESKEVIEHIEAQREIFCASVDETFIPVEELKPILSQLSDYAEEIKQVDQDGNGTTVDTDLLQAKFTELTKGIEK